MKRGFILSRDVNDGNVDVKAPSHSHDSSERVSIQLTNDLSLGASVVGLQLVAEAAKPEKEMRSFNLLADVLRSKSTNTLKVRAGSMSLFCRWCLKQEGEQPFPVREQSVYDYFCYLRDTGSAPTRADTFLSTLGFCAAVFDLAGADASARSMRVKGAALHMYLTKRPRRQAPELSTIMIACLEIAVCLERDSYLRALAGYCLSCVFGRLRCSDANRVVHGSVLGQFFEASLMCIKTSKSQEKRTTFIPLVCPAFGLLNIPWFEAYRIARRDLVLDEIPELPTRASDKSFLMLPSQRTLPYDRQRPVPTAEVTEGLRLILSRILPGDELAAITTHSMKTSLLSFANKFGMAYETSELLGFHLVHHHSALTYSRDSLSAPIRALSEMLEHIRSGAFVPGASRDSMFPDVEDQVAIVTQVERYFGMTIDDIADKFAGGNVHDMVLKGLFPRERYELLYAETRPLPPPANPTVAGLSTTSTSLVEECEIEDSCDSCSSDSGDSSVEEGFNMVAQKTEMTRVLNMPDHADMDSAFRHSRSRMIHLGNCDNPEKLACGRQLHATYVPFLGSLDRAFPKCSGCFGNYNA
eukprot:s268_g9.t1